MIKYENLEKIGDDITNRLKSYFPEIEKAYAQNDFNLTISIKLNIKNDLAKSTISFTSSKIVDEGDPIKLGEEKEKRQTGIDFGGADA